MEDDKTLRERLEEDVLDDTPWEALRLHVQKDAVLLVQNIPLVDAAEAFALDDAAKVSAWLQSGHIRRPTEDEQATFEDERATFQALIVQPWVLAQKD